MRRKITIIWTILGLIYAISLAISLYVVITTLKEYQLNQKLIQVIGIPCVCIGICIMLTFAFTSTIESYKNDSLVDENDLSKVEELGIESRKNGQIIFGFLGFVLFAAVCGIIAFVILTILKTVDTWLGIVAIVLCLGIALGCLLGIIFYKKLYSHDDYEIGLYYLRSLKK